jgi:tetratricopeptide (TPR) repeat protein
MYNETESVFDNLETVHYKAFAEALLELEERYISKEDWKKAEAMLIIAEDFVKKVTGAIKPRLHATMDAKWGIYLWKCGDYIEAEKKLQKANAGVLELIKKHGDEIKNENDIEKNNYLYARILQGFGTLYGDLLADKTQAIDYNQKCLKQLGKTKRTYRTQRMETSVLNNLGVAYHKMAELSTDKREENLKEAVKYYEKAMTLSRGISHLTMTGWLLFNAGEVYALLGEFEKAETCSLESRKIFSEEKPSERGMSGVEMLDAVIYLQKNMYPDAMASINKSIALREKLGEPRRIADALACRGDVYVGLGNKLKANEDYQQANKLYTTIGSQDGINKTEEKIKALS